MSAYDSRDRDAKATVDYIQDASPNDHLRKGLHADKQLFNDARDATEAEHNLTLAGAFKKYPKAVGWSIVVSCACVMEGYDMAVIGQLFAQDAFKQDFGEPDGNGGYEITTLWQILLGNSAYVGVILGILLNGIVSEKIGMKKTMLISYFLITAFTFILVFGKSKTVLLVGQFLCGIPWGVFNATAPTYAAEVCPTVLRGYLTTFINLTWVIGQLISAGIFRGVQGMDGHWAYGIPFAIQWVWPVPLGIATFFAPESPWWLLRQNRREDAEHALHRLSSGVDTQKTLAMMIRTDQEEREQSKSSYMDCFKGDDRRRTGIAFWAWSAQVLSGITMNQYNTYFFEQAGVSNQTAFDISICYYAIGFLGTVASWFLIARFGRRSIFTVGLSLMCALMFVIGFSALAPAEKTGAMWAQAVLLVVWVFLYDISVGPLAFCIVSEVGSSRLRAKTVAIGRCGFYFWFIIFGIATPFMLNPGAGNLKGKTFFIYGGTCLVMALWAYFRLPEMKGRTYEELDILFERKISAREFASTYVNAYEEGETDGSDPKQV